MAQQTAVQWLILQEKSNDYFSDEIIKKAKQMEKEQIINAWMATENELQRIAAEQYYNETYGKDSND